MHSCILDVFPHYFVRKIMFRNVKLKNMRTFTPIVKHICTYFPLNIALVDPAKLMTMRKVILS